MGEEDSPQKILTWNEQLRQWCESRGKTIAEIAVEIGMPRQTLSNYVKAITTEIDRVPYERRAQLYAATQIEIFKVEEGYEPKTSSNLNPSNRKGKRRKQIIDTSKTHSRIEDISSSTEGLTGIQRLEQGLLKFQQYKPSAGQRADAVMELIDVLAEEIDYYRSATSEERKVLVQRLQEDPESFGYVSQMLNAIYHGKQMDSWMMMAQPPSKIKRIRGERK